MDRRVFKTGPDCEKQHGIKREIAVSWPLPHWLTKAARLCSADAYVHWNTRAEEHLPNTGIKRGEPITVVVCGDGSVTLRFHEPSKSDIWETFPQRIDLESGKLSEIS